MWVRRVHIDVIFFLWDGIPATLYWSPRIKNLRVFQVNFTHYLLLIWRDLVCLLESDCDFGLLRLLLQDTLAVWRKSCALFYWKNFLLHHFLSYSCWRQTIVSIIRLSLLGGSHSSARVLGYKSRNFINLGFFFFFTFLFFFICFWRNNRNSIRKLCICKMRCSRSFRNISSFLAFLCLFDFLLQMFNPFISFRHSIDLNCNWRVAHNFIYSTRFFIQRWIPDFFTSSNRCLPLSSLSMCLLHLSLRRWQHSQSLLKFHFFSGSRLHRLRNSRRASHLPHGTFSSPQTFFAQSISEIFCCWIGRKNRSLEACLC